MCARRSRTGRPRRTHKSHKTHKTHKTHNPSPRVFGPPAPHSLLGTAEQLLHLSKLGQAASSPMMSKAFNL